MTAIEHQLLQALEQLSHHNAALAQQAQAGQELLALAQGLLQNSIRQTDAVTQLLSDLAARQAADNMRLTQLERLLAQSLAGLHTLLSKRSGA